MAAPLPFDNEKVLWRMYREDMELLRLLFPDSVNEVARDAIHALCDGLRRRHFGGTQGPMGQEPQTHKP